LVLASPAHAGDKVWRVGLLSNSGPPSGVTTSWRGGVMEILRRHGFELGGNVELVERYSEGHADRLAPLARELDATNADVIVAISQESVRAVLSATRATPIVMVVGPDPVAMGIVTSFAHPGGRVTGIVFQSPEGDAKRLQLLSEAIPGARRFGYLGMSFESVTKGEVMTRAANQLGLALTMSWVDGPTQYSTAFAALRNDGAAGVVIGANQPLGSDAARVIAAAQAEGLPTICEWEYMARRGCVFGFGTDLAYAQRRVGEYVARILKGADPSELPVERSDVWKLTVNVKAATALGLDIRPSLLARADEVIE
jgi:putative tryptophan/tyrosine transport system substrate-binding protein